MALSVPVRVLRHPLSSWPRFRGAGCRVSANAAVLREARAGLRPGLRGRHCLGTHFGGGPYAIGGPGYPPMPYHVPGGDCAIRDRAADLGICRPGRGVIGDESSELVARVRKRLYVRLRYGARPQARAA